MDLYHKSCQDEEEKPICLSRSPNCGHSNRMTDIFDVVTEEMNAMTENKFKKYKMSVLGGGRINVEKEKKTIEVYGYSVGYGKADHEKTAEVLKTKYPDFTITCSDDGY
ncbi:hypothetical protein GWI33_004287 [Rhynchophorus ferrugineus]|uniref:Uncharacterized protein n=1 Tax=Rhynchophorus ferrugineus TaxID=354439 RepID=A0A834IL01_RHYFE|nr:hypothetical protein GWI33_004287 [Rhynchophorus ferrugineus]